MKTPKILIAPKGCADYLTEGKEYQVKNFKFSDIYGGFFNIIDDEEELIDCVLKNDGHVGYRDWIIKIEE